MLVDKTKDVQLPDKVSVSAPHMTINDQEVSRVVSGSEVHQRGEPDATEEAVESPEAAISVPPHRRPDFQPPPPRQLGLQSSKVRHLFSFPLQGTDSYSI